ncbi:peptidoglycan DD-metalloendopeptidase family protein [Neobacillus dielmonensis]|uniref:peptidoglycan DD-metalloendopeptidase family protein n=1 Tax=Neobacillus dielmonensis TaxID=1347369 RepID=UPI0005A948EB|nr:M23 family metallopeptidase [Neobacillus dielmonensis]
MFSFNNRFKSKRIILKTAIASAMAASVIAFSSGPVAFATSSKLTTIYHVYVNGTYMGNVTNKEVLDHLVAEKVDSAKQNFQNINFNLDSQIQYIPEQVFRTSSAVNDSETIQNLNSSFQIQAEAAAIVIDGQPIVYLDNKVTAEEVLKNLKLQYVPADQLSELEARKASIDPIPPLGENETRIVDVRLSKNVSVDERKIAPESIMTPDAALTYLQKGTLEEKKYAVQPGDAIETIAHQNGLKTDELLALNPGLTVDTLLHIGQEVNITALKPYVEVVVDKEVNQREEIPFTQKTEEDASMDKGDTKVKQAGQNGARTVTYAISEQNGETVKKEQTDEQVLQQPVDEIVVKGTKVVPSRGDGSLAWPTVGGYVSSEMGYRWGRKHKGIDIARPSNRTIKAADNGVVVSAGWDNGGYGNKVIIDHQNGMRTLYGHMESINVKPGQTVSKGSAIGVMGATGDATGIHLHFEVTKNGSLENPLSYLR